MLEPLTDALAALPPEDILAWHLIFDEYQKLSYKRKLWAAAYVINGGCSDDSFDYFRAWLTAQGKEVFLGALADPDSLADYEACEEGVEFEDIMSAAIDAFEKIGEGDTDDFYRVLDGQELPVDVKEEMKSEIKYADDIDLMWEEDEKELRELLPKISMKFSW